MSHWKKAVIIVAAVLALCGWGRSNVALAQSSDTQKQLDLAAAQAQRKALVGQAMNLSPDEDKTFWPVYNEYEGKMDRIELRHMHELQAFAAHYNTLTDDDAAKKLDEVMAIQEARLETQKEYIPKFRAVISQIKVTRFFQVDNKMRAMLQCDIANAVPLAVGPGERGPR